MKTFLISIFVFSLSIVKISSAQEFYFCDYVDDNWNPVGASSQFPAGGINFLTKLNSPVFNTLYMWVIYKIDDQGNDIDFVNEYAMRVDPSTETTGARFFCTTDKIYFHPGKYRVYFIYESDKENMFKYGNLKKYLSKGEVTVN